MRLLVIALLVAWAAPVAAQPAGHAVALLPLDAEKRLEIYGQPVAHAVGDALTHSGIEVVVVGAKMAVPERAQLIVDGTIKGNKGEITLAVRLRDPKTGAVLDTLSASAKDLTSIESAALQLSLLVVPAVQRTLTEFTKPAGESNPHPAQAPSSSTDAKPAPPPVMLVAVTGTTIETALLRDALTAEITVWSERHHHAASPTDISHLSREVATKAVAGASAAFAVSFEIAGYTTERQGEIPLARARVRVRVADRERVLFDRIVITDSIVGDKNLPPPVLATRAARSVLDIVEPHLSRAVPAWRRGGPRT
jgi:hypothetical protein